MPSKTAFKKVDSLWTPETKTPPKNRIVMRLLGGCLLFILDKTVNILVPYKEAQKAYILEKLKYINCTNDTATYLGNQSEGDSFVKINKVCKRAKLAVYKQMLANTNGDVSTAEQNAVEGNDVFDNSYFSISLPLP